MLRPIFWLTLSLPVAVAAEPVAITAERMIDVERGVVVDDAVVIVDGERIERVGGPVPDEATVIDLGDATLLPGLLDSHVDLTASHEQQGYKRLGVSVPRMAINGVAAARRTLLAGFTTVRNVGARGYADVALRDAIAEGTVIGPRILAAGPSLGITGGHCDNNLLPPEYAQRSEGVADGPWAVRQAVRRNVKYGADVIKFCGTGGVLSKGTEIGAQQYTLEEMRALVDEAHQLGRKVAVHAHGTQGIKTAIRAGVDSVEHASLIDAEGLRLARENGTYLSMDIYVSDFILTRGESVGILPESLEKERQVGASQRASFRRALEAGVKLAYGTDAGVYPHGDNGRQLAYLVEYGMSPMQALQTATIETARLLGMDNDVGSIGVGKYADIVAVPGNPLEQDGMDLLSEQVRFVMKGGEVYADALSSAVSDDG